MLPWLEEYQCGFILVACYIMQFWLEIIGSNLPILRQDGHSMPPVGV